MGNSENKRYSETLSEMIRIATLSKSNDVPTENEKEFHRYVEKRFPNVSSVCEKIDLFDGGIMYRWPGTDGKSKPLALMSHFDVAAVDGEWDKPPFSGEIADGKIYGRGAADTKGSLCAFLEAAEKLIKEGYKPKTDVYLLSSSREEIGGKDAELFKDYFVKNGINPGLLVDEGGAVLDNPMSFISGRYAMIAMSERSSAKFKINGGDAEIEKFKKTVLKTRLADFAFSDEVAEMFGRMAKTMSFPMNAVFKHLNLTKGILCRIMPKISHEAGAMVAPSVSFAETDGTQFCTVACTYGHGIESIVGKVKTVAAKCGVTVTVENLRSAPKPTDFRASGVKLVEKTVTEVFENTTPTPFIIFGGTDARHFGGVADCVVRFAPLIMTNDIISRVHKPNEYIFEESVWKAVEFYIRLIKNYRVSQK